MKTIKKILCAILISVMTLFVVPAVIPTTDMGGYTVEAASIKLNKTKKTMNKGETYTLKISGTKKKVTWSSSNKSVATVNSKGKVTAKKKGTATITAKVGGKKYKCKITVESPSISKTKIYVEKGKTYTLKVKNTSQTVKWSSSEKSIATVSSKGKVTAKKAGTATITAKVGSTKFKCKVVVEKTSLNKTSITLEEGNTYTLKVNGTSRDISWSSSNKSIATVNSSGKVTAKAVGTATITAKFGDRKLTCKVTVTEPNYVKYVSTSYTKLPNDRILISIKNTGSVKLDDITLEVKFYKNGSLISSRYAYANCLVGGRTVYDTVYAPYDDNGNLLEYDQIKISVTDVYNFSTITMSDLYSKVSITHNKSSEAYYGVVGEITNIGSEEISYVNVGVIYYKDGKIVGYDIETVSSLSAGASKTVKFYSPYDADYNELEFDSYKVVKNYAYTYK